MRNSGERSPVDPGDVLVLSCDGKGIVMRPDALRPATARQAAASKKKLKSRLSKGEKRNRKRIAEVGAVYDLTPAPRTSKDILPRTDAERAQAAAAPARSEEHTSELQSREKLVCRLLLEKK